MSPPDASAVDWARLLQETIPSSPASHVTVVRCVAVDGVIQVTFHGAGHLRAHLFGVRIPVHEAIGDAWWRAAIGPNPNDPLSTAGPEDWARLLAITEVMEPYDMMDPQRLPEPDPDGVRWLFQFG